MPRVGWLSLLGPLAVPHQLSCVSVSFRSISVPEMGSQQTGMFCPFPQPGLGWAKSDVMRVGTRPWGWLLALLSQSCAASLWLPGDSSAAWVQQIEEQGMV